MTFSPSFHEVDIVVRALLFATHHHRDQRRKGKDHHPYINHPVEVMGLLWDPGGVRDPATLAAALLHDVIEDCGVTSAELTEAFGAEITSLVLEVTDDTALSRAQRRQAQIAQAPRLSPRAREIRLADKLHNLRSLLNSVPEGWDMHRVSEYVQWSQQVIALLRGSNLPMEILLDEVLEKLFRTLQRSGVQ